MKTFRLNKLVRDKAVQQMEEAGGTVKWRKLDADEYTEELAAKLEEELDELDEEVGKDRTRDLSALASVAEVYEEAWEVLDREEYYELFEDAMEELEKGIDMWEIDPDELLLTKTAKNQEQGGFKNRVYVQTVSLDESSPLFEKYSKNPEA